MGPASTFFRETGDGPGVVCLHANASSSSQWRALAALLEPRHRVLAPDAYGAGRGPAWPVDRRIGLRDEVALLDAVFARAGAAFALVGHSYGAAVALVAAVRQPARIRALVVYEPTLFSLIDAASPSPNEADGIRHAVGRARAALEARDPDGAAWHFIDYWMGQGAWDAMPESRRAPIAAAVVHVGGWRTRCSTSPRRCRPLRRWTCRCCTWSAASRRPPRAPSPGC